MRRTPAPGNYRHSFDAGTGFMRGKKSDGAWNTPFDPRSNNHWKDDYCEGNAWQWTWFVPHDVQGLMALILQRHQRPLRQ